jgi:hypothetical protein
MCDVNALCNGAERKLITYVHWMAFSSVGKEEGTLARYVSM